LALYEPPYNADDDKAKHDFAEEKKRMAELFKAGKRGDAVAFFLASMTIPEMIEGMKQSQEWQVMKTLAHTLAYEYAVLGDGSVPLDFAAKAATIPTLVMDGGKSEAFMQEAAESLGKAMPCAQRKTLQNQTQEVSPKALAAVLKEFFVN
jgi:hypothetical protein